MDPSGPFNKARQAIFLSSSVAPFTPWVRHPWEDGPMGWRFKAQGMMVQRPWDDGSKTCGETVSVWMPSTAQTSERLSRSHYGTWHMSFFNWILSRIKASLRLSCTFLINIRVYLSNFFIFNCNLLSKHNRHPCQRPPRSIYYIRRRHTFSVQLLHPSLTHFLHSFTKNW